MADNPNAGLGPEAHVIKATTTVEVQQVMTEDGTRLVALVVYHATGKNVFLMMPDYAKQVANNLLAGAGGLTVATSPLPPHHNGRDN